jgi:hypothetical protein
MYGCWEPNGFSQSRIGGRTGLILRSGQTFDRAGWNFGPFSPRAIVVSHVLETGQLQGPESVRRTDAALSVGYDVLIRRHSYFSEHLSNFFCCSKYRNVATSVEIRPLEVHSSWNTPTTRSASFVRTSPFVVGSYIEKNR